MTSPKLKNCPFCGERPKTHPNTPAIVKCSWCGIAWMSVEQWNTRAPVAVLDEAGESDVIWTDTVSAARDLIQKGTH